MALIQVYTHWKFLSMWWQGKKAKLHVTSSWDLGFENEILICFRFSPMNRGDFYNENEKAVSGNGPCRHKSWGRLMWVWGTGCHDTHNLVPCQASLLSRISDGQLGDLLWGSCIPSWVITCSLLIEEGLGQGYVAGRATEGTSRDARMVVLHWLGSLKTITVDSHNHPERRWLLVLTVGREDTGAGRLWQWPKLVVLQNQDGNWCALCIFNPTANLHSKAGKSWRGNEAKEPTEQHKQMERNIMFSY